MRGVGRGEGRGGLRVFIAIEACCDLRKFLKMEGFLWTFELWFI
jgi:hypothetical protein